MTNEALFPDQVDFVPQVPLRADVPSWEQVYEALPRLARMRMDVVARITYDCVLDGIAGGAIDMTWGSYIVSRTIVQRGRKAVVVPKETKRVVFLQPHVDRIDLPRCPSCPKDEPSRHVRASWATWNGWCARWNLKELMRSA